MHGRRRQRRVRGLTRCTTSPPAAHPLPPPQPSLTRSALLKWTPLEDGFQIHLISSCMAGIAGTLVTAPVDMIKTRLMLQGEFKGVRVYRNGFHCAYKVVQTEGVKSLYKGGFANFARLGPQTTITLVCEKLRELAGMNAI